MTKWLIIPSRWGSARFPGKPLFCIAGRTLLARVIDLAMRSTRGISDISIAVATDDQRIAFHSEAMGCRALLTDPAIQTGTERVLAAADTLGIRSGSIINLQGDAPLIPAVAVSMVLDALAHGTRDCVTPVARLSWRELDKLREHKLRQPSSGTTCVLDAAGRALWFSKSILPAMRDEAELRISEHYSPVYRHLGLYGYSVETLRLLTDTHPSRYEQIEGLEQLRLIEMGVPIQTVLIDSKSVVWGGIDTPADAAVAEKFIAQHGDPFGL